MRILMAATTFLRESRGGMDNHAFSLAQYLRSAGHDVAMLYRVRAPAAEGSKLVDEEPWQGIKVFKIERGSAGPWPNPYPFYDRQVEALFGRVLEAYRPDLVHFHHLAELSTSLVTIAARRGLPTVMTLHDFWPMCFMSHLRTPDGLLCPGPDEGLRCAECWGKRLQAARSPAGVRAQVRDLGLRESLRRAPRFLTDKVIGRLAPGYQEIGTTNLRTEMASLATRNHYMRRTLDECDVLIAPSHFLLDKFVEWGIAADRFRHMYNSVPASLRELRAAARPPRERIAFGFVGSLYPPKGVEVLVGAFARLHGEQADLRIWGTAPYAGAQTYVDRLRDMARGVPNLTFEGGFAPPELPAVLGQIDVLVIPSTWYENNPLVILEAFAAGIPVLAGDIGGMAELVQDDVNGRHFRVGDADDLAQHMRMMLDRDRLARYRAATPLPASHEELGAEVERVYRGLVERRV